jgi:glycerol-3-phosphate acyltransferase PlsY
VLVLSIVLICIVSYGLGSISFAVLTSLAFGLADPRTYGSGNPGATNVLRSGNRWAAGLTLLGDGAKGFVAVVLAKYLAGLLGVAQAEQLALLVALAGFFAFLGHVFPIFLKFKGGKGVATALGVLLGLDWRVGLATAGTWLLVAIVLRYSSLAALLAAIGSCVYTFFAFGLSAPWFAVVAMTGLILFRHKSNIAKLLAGQEPRIGKKSAA